MYLEIYLIILGTAVILLLIFCIPILMGVWRTIKDVAVILETLNSSLPSILKNLEGITANINNSTTVINREVQNISGTLDRFHSMVNDVADNVQNIAPRVVKSVPFRTIKNVIAVAKGIRAFLNVLSKPAKRV